MRLRPKKVRDRLAFGVFGSNRHYLLSRAKFPLIAEEIAQLAREHDRPLRILDAGIGRCRLQRLFRLRFPEVAIDWHGIDLLDLRIRIRADVRGVHRARGAIEKLPYASGVFDTVVCCWVLQHLVDPERALAECARVLAPGGALILATPNSPQPVKFIQERCHARLVTRQKRRGKYFSYQPQIQFYDRPRLRRLLQSVGAEPVRWQGVGLVTGGPLSFLENYEWYYQLNTWIGARIPSWTKQLICFARIQPSENPIDVAWPEGRPRGDGHQNPTGS